MQIVDPDRIRMHREARRWSLRTVAGMCGRNSAGKPMCSHTAISMWERGKARVIPEETAVRLSLILQFPMASVFRPDEGFVMPETSTGACADEQVAS